MGVTTTKTNKPLNPRGNDQSPKGFNRAKLFSGKALDFDGVNDYLASGAFSLDTSEWSASMILKNDTAGSDQIFLTFAATGSNDESFIIYNNFANSNKISFYGAAFTGSPVNFDYVIPTDYEHLTFTFASNTLSLYVNGVFVDSGSVTGNDGTQTASAIVGARKQASYGQYFDGQVSGVKMYSTALTAAQVADLYNNPEKVVPTGVDNTALKLWLPMMEGAGTTAYNGAPDALGSELITNGDFATDSDWLKGTGWSIANGKASKVTGSATELVQIGAFPSDFSSKKFKISFTLEVTAGSVRLRAGLNNQSYLNSSGSYVYCLTPTGNDQLKFGADSSFVGSIDNVSIQEISNNGTISGATWTHAICAPVAQTSVIDWNKHTLDGTNEVLIPQGLTAGRDLLGNLFENVRKQGALNLDGNSWAEVHDNASLEIPNTDDVTMEIWFNRLDTPAQDYSKWIDAGEGTLNDTNYSMGSISTIDEVFVEWRTSSSGWIYTDTDVTFNKNEWTHLVVTIEMTGANSSIKTYKNGVLSSTKSQTTTRGTGGKTTIGRTRWNTARTMPDQIAQPRIYNRALTAEEVQRSYDSGKNIYTNS